jgi:hypothetical protein
MKVQGHSSTARAKKGTMSLMHRTRKFTTLTQMDVAHRKIGRKILDLHSKKMRIWHMILGDIIIKPGVDTQAEAIVGAELKTYLFIARSTKKILTIRQGTIQSS